MEVKIDYRDGLVDFGYDPNAFIDAVSAAGGRKGGLF